MKILQKYLFKEYLRYWYAITSILILILISDKLASILSRAIRGELDSSVILPLFVANVFQYSDSLIPLGLFLGIMLAMGRLYHESEMVSAYACGLSPKNMVKPTFYIGLVGFFIVSLLVFVISPWAARIEQNIISLEEARQEIDKIEAGKFNVSKDKKTVIFFQTKNSSKLNSVFVETINENGYKNVELSESANIGGRFEQNSQYFIFKEGTAYSKDIDERNIVQYREHGILLGQKDELKKQKAKIAAASTWYLIKSNNLRDKSELHWRIALPISTLMLALLALPLSHSAPRKGRYSRLMLALLFYLFYVNLLIFARKSISNGTISPEIGMWWVHALTFSLVAYLNRRRQKYG